MSAAGNGAGHGRMAEPGKGDRDVVERLTLAAVGVVSLTADRIEELAGELSERAGESLAAVARQLGLVTREEMDELELRVAQLEHRLRLLERPREVQPPPAS